MSDPLLFQKIIDQQVLVFTIFLYCTHLDQAYLAKPLFIFYNFIVFLYVLQYAHFLIAILYYLLCFTVYPLILVCFAIV